MVWPYGAELWFVFGFGFPGILGGFLVFCGFACVLVFAVLAFGLVFRAQFLWVLRFLGWFWILWLISCGVSVAVRVGFGFLELSVLGWICGCVGGCLCFGDLVV